MPGHLRVFISSTMKDLANERDAAQRRLESFNFTPVFAEEWVPSGTGIWERIVREIKSCDVFLLIVGEKYGYIPPGWNLSVTHAEYLVARDAKMPVLPFFRKLSYESRRRSREAKARDAFRKEVSEWPANNVVTEFTLASDLADHAGASVVAMLTDRFREMIADRASHPDEPVAVRLPARVNRAVPDLPKELVDAVKRREAVLFAGSGISMNAGLPSAAAFAQHLAAALHEKTPDYDPIAGSAFYFANVAADAEAVVSREFIIARVRELLEPPLAISPTSAHHDAVRLFDTIITTNYDMLFERAAAGRAGAPAIIKLHGSVNDPSTLVLTELDLAELGRRSESAWREVQQLFSTRPVVVLGTSLRDPSILRLLQESKLQRGGYFVAPEILQATAARVRRLGLHPIATDADALMTTLRELVG